jgi:DNA-binding LacI/PurR family transcriptional regulator
MFQTFRARGFESLATLSLGLLSDHPRMNIQPYAQKYEMTIEEEYFFKSPSFSGMAWRESFNVACKIIDRIKRHKLIFCSSDFAALGLCDALRLAGLEPGKDISVVGYDNVEGHKITAPPSEAFLSSIEKNDHSAGKKMVESLLADIISPERYKDNNVIEISAQFIPRKSLGWNK